jgi:plastocyanin
MTGDFPSRRSILKASGLVLAGLAGCSGAEGRGNDRQTETPGGGDGTSGDSRDADDHSQDEDGGHHEDSGGHHEDSGGHHEDSGGHHEDSGGHGTSSLEGPTDSATVRMMSTESGHHFDPHVVWVETGGTVTWVNESGGHTATAYHPDNAGGRPLRIPSSAESWDSGVKYDEGAAYEHTFEVEGVYDYHCLPHENLGMIGSVIVGTPDFDGQQGLQAPQEDLSHAASEKIGNLNDTVEQALRTYDE